MYPTRPKDLNLSFFKHLRDIYQDKIKGFSSHEDPNEYLSGALSYGMGARIFEKHIALETKKYASNKYSVSPNQFSKWLNYLVMSMDRVGSVKQRAKNINFEREQLKNFKRGIYLKKGKYVKKGELIKKEHITFQYPAAKNQLLANDFSRFSTFIAKNDINPSSAILKKNIVVFNKKEKNRGN